MCHIRNHKKTSTRDNKTGRDGLTKFVNEPCLRSDFQSLLPRVCEQQASASLVLPPSQHSEPLQHVLAVLRFTKYK